MYPARSVFCYYLNFGDSWITGWKGEMAEEAKGEENAILQNRGRAG